MSGDANLPVVDPPASTPTCGGDVAGVLLAAGTSSRFGDANKLLAPIDGEPIVRHAGRTLVTADCTPRVAVLGHDADAVRDALSGLGFEFVVNSAFEEGQSTSVRAAIEALGEDVTGAVFALGDMPFVDPSTVESLVATFCTEDWSAVAPAYRGNRGNPVIFGRRHFDALADVSGDVGGREILLGSDDAALVSTEDPGVRRDVDTSEDYERLRRSRDDN